MATWTKTEDPFENESETMRIETKAKVRVVLEIDASSSAWSENEPGLGRAFTEAREDALRKLNRTLAGDHSIKGERGQVRLLKVEAVDLYVTATEQG